MRALFNQVSYLLRADYKCTERTEKRRPSSWQRPSQVLLILAMLSSLCIVPAISNAQAVEPTGSIVGTVSLLNDAAKPDTIILRIIETGEVVTARKDGTFQFNGLVPGEYQLSAIAVGYQVPDTQLVEVQTGQVTTVVLTLIPIEFLLNEITVRGERFPATVSQQSIGSLEIQRLPGTGGDALRAISALPGVAVANDFSGELYIRGGGPEDNVFYFDRTPLGYAYHFGGLVSTISTEIIDRVDIYPGGFGAEFGANAQAIIDIYSRSKPSRELGGKFNINLLYSEAFVEGRAGGIGSWYFAGRRSYVDLFPIQVEQITRFPRFWDYQFRLTLDLSPMHELSLSAFAADDVFELNLDLDDVDNDPTFAGDFGFQDRFNTQAIRLRSLLGDRLTSDLSLSRFTREFSINFGQGYFLNIQPTDYQLREDLTYRVNQQAQLESGFIVSSGPRRASSYFTRPPDEGEVDFDFAFAEKVRINAEERFDTLESYLQTRYTPLPFLSMALGVRVDYFNLTRQVSVGPRASLSFAMPTGAELRFAYGRYEQSPQPYQILDDIGNPDVRDSVANHYILEIERPLSPNTKVKVASFYKELSELITRDPKAVYLNQANGFARGIEFSISHRVGERFFGWANYTHSVSKRQDRPGDPERLYSFDQPHLATLTASYRLGDTWEIGAKWQYASGLPYTPVERAVQIPHPNTGELVYVPVYGAVNSRRYPPVHRLDLRVRKEFRFNAWKMGVFLEIFNAYNRKNVLQYEYNEDYTELEEVNTQLPLLPYLGVTIEF